MHILAVKTGLEVESGLETLQSICCFGFSPPMTTSSGGIGGVYMYLNV